MDIIVTTPKSDMANAAREAAACIRDAGGEYFRRFRAWRSPQELRPGDRIYYVEDGFIRGFAIVDRKMLSCEAQRCDTTGREWPPGDYFFMRADSWKWIRPIPMRGFQGFRYVNRNRRAGFDLCEIWIGRQHFEVVILGGWRDPKPAAPKEAIHV